jgi:hypothetical protein
MLHITRFQAAIGTFKRFPLALFDFIEKFVPDRLPGIPTGLLIITMSSFSRPDTIAEFFRRVAFIGGDKALPSDTRSSPN